MKVGLSKEEYYEGVLASCHTFAERHLIMTIRDLLKYDGRTKESKRAVAQGRLRIATATDADIEELARLESEMKDGGGPNSIPDTIENYKRLRAELGEKGIKRSELECR